MYSEEKMCDCLSEQIDCVILLVDFEKRLFVLVEGSDVSDNHFTLVQLHSDDIVPMYGFDVDYYDSYYPVQILSTCSYDAIMLAYNAIVNCPK